MRSWRKREGYFELDLSIVNILAGSSHRRMVEFLSQRDSYNETHCNGARQIGVFLKAGNIRTPNVIYIVTDKVDLADDVILL